MLSNERCYAAARRCRHPASKPLRGRPYPASAPRRLIALLLAAPAAAAAAVTAPAPGFGVAPQPWPPLSGGAFSGPAAPESPDPLVAYVWPLPAVNDSVLQITAAPAVAAGPSAATARDAFLNAASAAGSIACNITVQGNGTLVVDFGVERAAWFEFDSADLPDAELGNIVVGISEYDVVDWLNGFKQGGATKYGSGCGAGAAPACTYRLETSAVGPELYEGVRYGFISLRSAPARPFTISALRVVGQAKPVNYVGRFSSAGDPLLERVWYTAVYTVRATLQADYMGSILMNRGDRFSWTGGEFSPSVPSFPPAVARTPHAPRRTMQTRTPRRQRPWLPLETSPSSSTTLTDPRPTARGLRHTASTSCSRSATTTRPRAMSRPWLS